LWVDASGKCIAPLGERVFINELKLSRDGRKLAVAAGDSSSDVWIYDSSHGMRNRLTSEGINGAPVWSPDGTRIAYAKRQSGPFGIYTRNADGTGSEELVSGNRNACMVSRAYFRTHFSRAARIVL
jgi:Tol biopolymer transport system component